MKQLRRLRQREKFAVAPGESRGRGLKRDQGGQWTLIYEVAPGESRGRGLKHFSHVALSCSTSSPPVKAGGAD